MPKIEEQPLERLPEAWERSTGESTTAYHAFTTYLNLPVHERSIRRAAEIVRGESKGKARGSVETLTKRFEQWSSRFMWVARAAAHEEWKQREVRRAEVVAIREMGQRHARAAMRVVKQGLAALDSLKVEEMSAGDILNYIEKGAKLERLARGVSADGVMPELPDEFEVSTPQDRIRAAFEDPAVARAGAMFAAQMRRVEREREEGAS